MPEHFFRFPPPAPPGSRVHVVAPSGLVDPERFARGAALLESWGYELHIDEATVLATGRYTAGTAVERTAALQAAIADPDASIIWAARGGYGATLVLPGLDLEPLEAHPKWLVGFSDVTALHAAWQRAGWGTLHGPVVSNVHRWTEPARDQLRAWLEGAHTGRLEGRLLAGAEPADGPLLGGNLSLLTSLVGTPYLPPLAGSIVLLEDLNEEPYRLDRYLTQLRQSGVLDDVRGFVLGQWTRCGESRDEAVKTLVERLSDLDVPILGYVPVGHERTSWPAPLGARARIVGAVGADGHLLLERPPVV